MLAATSGYDRTQTTISSFGFFPPAFFAIWQTRKQWAEACLREELETYFALRREAETRFTDMPWSVDAALRRRRRLHAE
ncbi:hypothetical protein J2Y48_001599 [Mycoplana sp. BE70]|nr:hypothetical protein [Mycoplana sp. BE70]